MSDAERIAYLQGWNDGYDAVVAINKARIAEGIRFIAGMPEKTEGASDG